MNHLYPHRVWLVLLTMAIIVLFGSAPLLRDVQDKAGKHLQTVKAAHDRIEQSIRQLDKDVATVRKLSGQMNQDQAERVLALVDRLQIASLLEHQAAQQRLSHFTYSLSPEQKQTVDTPIGSQDLALSTLDIAADAPLDTDAYAFIDQLRQRLPGRVRLRQLSLERGGKSDGAMTAANLHLTATLEWLSNGAVKSSAGGL